MVHRQPMSDLAWYLMTGSVTPGASEWTTNGWACKLLKISGCRGPEYTAVGQRRVVQPRKLLNQMTDGGYESLRPCSTTPVALLIRVTKVENLTMTAGHNGIAGLNSVDKSSFFLLHRLGSMTDLTLKEGLLNDRLGRGERPAEPKETVTSSDYSSKAAVRFSHGVPSPRRHLCTLHSASRPFGTGLGSCDRPFTLARS
ncbi:hypothetical protein N7510_003161 [Penicillium lagena]|uniref:uncharacterized protein n=1 Tax=Penicillium lagena TaxID=94218 RepID=UPI002540621A|nr:uncharacterized protein N7510_003161 [Penicillium lagena]KAJ5619177.1 hypothetical protein N7510_003161 [Penicillium lagena]